MGNVMCHFCCEYREAFQVVHKNGNEKFDMCYRCAFNFQGKDVWREVKEEKKNQNV